MVAEVLLWLVRTEDGTDHRRFRVALPAKDRRNSMVGGIPVRFLMISRRMHVLTGGVVFVIMGVMCCPAKGSNKGAT